MGRLGRAIAALFLALAGLVAVSTPVLAQPSTDLTGYRAQSIACASLDRLRRELLTLSRTDTPTVAAMDSAISRMSSIVPRVPRIPGSTLAVLLEQLKAQRAELAADGLSVDLVARIQKTASESYGLFAFVACV